MKSVPPHGRFGRQTDVASAHSRPRSGELLASLRTSMPALPSANQREYAFSSADFERIRVLIHEHAGIVLVPSKQDMVYGRLARRVRERGLPTFSAYLDLIMRDKQEWTAFVNALTTNLTSFFREAHHFRILAERLLAADASRPYEIWCCAASTGEEPYSLAITACDAFDSLRPPVKIIATDINSEVIQEAMKGEYPADRLSTLTPAQKQKYFTRLGTEGSGQERYVVRPELKQLISFSCLNLLAPNWSVRGPLDAIFCRNVMIYFDKPTQSRILQRFHPLLKKDGLLFAGHSESFVHASDLYRPMGRTVYQRVDR